MSRVRVVALNRALLERQLLMRRSQLSPPRRSVTWSVRFTRKGAEAFEIRFAER